MNDNALRPTTRNAIIDAAIIVLAGNASATMSEIALKAGVGRATLHRQFRSRDDLIRAIKDQCIRETDEASAAADHPNAPAFERLRAMFAAIIPLGDRYHFLTFEGASDDAITNRYQRELDWVETLKNDGELAADVPTSWVVAQIDQLVWTAWCEVAAGRVALADAPALAVRTLTKGLGV
ncbi:MAG: helix-turn-helix domain containing protein [Gammaproteobacteria bacterium]|nr:helix-turn-helix domain containing protein [Gammaproteobacteria bacterium]